MILCLGQEEDLETLLRWHQSTIEAIRSIRCEVEVRWTHPGVPGRREGPDSDPLRGRYARDGDRVRMDRFREFSTDCWIYKDGKCYSFTHPMGQSIGILSQDRCIGFVNVESYMGIVLDYPLRESFHRLPGLLRLAKPLRSVQVKGDLVEIDADFPVPDHPAVWKSRFTLDKSLGCMVVEVANTSGNGGRAFRIKEFEEFADGIRFPTRMEATLEKDGMPITIMTMRLSRIRINEPIPEAEFTLSLPHGTEVLDSTRKKKYKVNSRGERISEETDLVSGTFRTAQEQEGRPAVGGPSEVEPGDAVWMKWGAAFALLLLVTALVWRRWRG